MAVIEALQYQSDLGRRGLANGHRLGGDDGNI